MAIPYTVAGLVMDGATPDDFGMVYSVKVDGWGGPGTKQATAERSNSDGDSEGIPRYNSRKLTLTIWGTGPDEMTCRAAWDEIADRLELGNQIVVQSGETPPRSVTGLRTGEALRTFEDNRLTASVLISCKDPRKYGPRQTVSTTLPTVGAAVPPFVPPLAVGGSGGSVVVTNNGKYPTPGILRFTGPLPGPFYAVNTRDNAREAFDMDLAVGDIFVVDLLNGTYILNGIADRRGARTFDSKRWLFRKGDTTVLFGAAGTTTGQLAIDYAPAWMS